MQRIVISRKNRSAAVHWTLLFTLMTPLSAHAIGLPDVSVHGMVSQGFLQSTDNNAWGLMTAEGTFEYSEAALNFSSTVAEDLRVGLQIFSRDFGSDGNHRIELDWARGDYRWRQYLGFRFGKIKIPMGLYNKGRDMDMLRSTVMLPMSVYDEDYRDVLSGIEGGSVYGVLPTRSAGTLEYEIFGGTIDLDNRRLVQEYVSVLAIQLGNELGDMVSQVSTSETSGRAEYLVGGALTWDTPLIGLRLGGSLFSSKVDMSSTLEATTSPVPLPIVIDIDAVLDLTYAYTLSTEYMRGRFRFVAEYRLWKYNVGTTLSRVPVVGSYELTIDDEMEGYYGLVAYRCLDWLELTAYYSEFYERTADRAGDRFPAMGLPKFLASEKDLCLAARIDINPHWLVKLEGHYLDGLAFTHTELKPNLDDLERHWGLFAVKTTFSF